MKVIYTLIFVGLAFTAHTQNNSYTITQDGIDDIKLGMRKDELEKAINQNIILPQNSRKGAGLLLDTFHLRYGELEADILFSVQYTGENTYDYIVHEISSSNTLLRTKKGIGIGDDKFKIINVYEGYTLWLVPGYSSDSYISKSKSRSSIWLHGETTDSAIIFQLDNNKIVRMSVCYYEKGG